MPVAKFDGNLLTAFKIVVEKHLFYFFVDTVLTVCRAAISAQQRNGIDQQPRPELASLSEFQASTSASCFRRTMLSCGNYASWSVGLTSA